MLKVSIRQLLLVNLKNGRVLAPLNRMLFGIELWRQWQPLIFPSIQASNGALRSMKHERRNVVTRYTGWRLQNDQNSYIASRDANTTRCAFFESFTGINSTKKIGVNVSFNLRY